MEVSKIVYYENIVLEDTFMTGCGWEIILRSCNVQIKYKYR